MISQAVRTWIPWLSRVVFGKEEAMGETYIELLNCYKFEELSHRPFQKFKSKAPSSVCNLFSENTHVIGRCSTTLQPKPLSDGRTASETKIVNLSAQSILTAHFWNREQWFLLPNIPLFLDNLWRIVMKHNKNSRNANRSPTSRNQDGDFSYCTLAHDVCWSTIPLAPRWIVKTNPTRGG